MRRFRVWHTELGRYLKDNEFYINPDGSVYSAFESYDNKIRKTDYIETFSRDDFDEGYIIREDDTGLKDKKGKEIYEGDIVSEEFEYGGEKTKTIWQVRWCDDEYAFGLHYVSGFEVEDCSLVADDEENHEVIGNVHENADLLEELNEN